ncbi:MAG: dipicolinate synthase subunit DpsA [Bacillota bacterium]|nr:dipicolinate synthase subunit DpsA [Bacillota bacterium]
MPPALPDVAPARAAPAAPPPVVSVLGGDERERDLIIALSRAGHRVRVCGRVLSAPELAAGAAESPAPAEALEASTIIAPLAGISGDGQVFSRQPHPGLTIDAPALSSLRPGTLLCSGAVGEPLRSALTARGVRFVDLAADDELAILNSIPSAEGAMQMAMEQSPFCLHGAAALVLGFGRTAQTLALMLRGIGSQVTVVARSPAARASAEAFCLYAAPFGDLSTLLQTALFCFNTVPAPVLTADTLAGANPELTIIDLASRPGGTDFAAAHAAGLRATLAPGLPGLVAPRTAGRLLSKVILGLLEENRYDT